MFVIRVWNWFVNGGWQNLKNQYYVLLIKNIIKLAIKLFHKETLRIRTD